MLILLAACNLPISTDPPPAEMNGKINTWLDAPLDGDQIPLAAYEIVLHANAPAGLQRVELSINQQAVSLGDLPVGQAMSEIRYTWLPMEPGVYTITARTIDQNDQQDQGSSVQVVVLAEPTTVPEAATPDLPTITASATAAPSPTPTATHTPPPAGLLAGLTVQPNQLVVGNCGVNQVNFTVQVNDPVNTKQVVLFVRLRDANSTQQTAWNSGYAMNPGSQNGIFSYLLSTANIPENKQFDSAFLEYQFVGTGTGGEVIERSPTFGDVTITQCGISLPFITIAPQLTLLPIVQTPTPTHTPVIIR